MSTKTNASATAMNTDESKLLSALGQYWGYDQFRPLQLDAMQAVMQDQDSLVVFPTGAGKSLCFQAPAVCRDGLAVVISPLISLMKDQVDTLKACGINAAVLNSSLSGAEEQDVIAQMKSGDLKLLYLAPERLLTEGMKQLLQSVSLSYFAIDEAHCVSQWGHDFRPEYRKLNILKEQFPGTAIHAYTATATTKVRDDIAVQLGMFDARVLVGSMDRPNLNYQLKKRERGLDQYIEILDRHKGCSGIMYCISRKEVEANAAALCGLGYSAAAYHAGMSAEDRKKTQEAFLKDEVDIIVATVAFGMGIDKSNVRFVIHASMPKSLEAYQQESGRAGRDGLESDCCLFYSPGDFVTWNRMIDQSESQSGREGAVQALKAISDFCNSITCRHAALAAHFGETMEPKKCGACDVCLGKLDLVEDALILAQKIVSCVFRVDQRFGADYVAQVLVGSRDQRILKNQHDQVSTYGLLSTENKKSVRTWIEQLISQGFLIKSGEFNVITITDSGWQLLKGNAEPSLTRASKDSAARSSKSSTASWEGVDKDLFEALRALRSQKAQAQNVPAYVVFGDASLRDMARKRPSTLDGFRLITGVGQKKFDDYGEAFLKVIVDHCQASNVDTDVKVQLAEPKKAPSKNAIPSFDLFKQGLSVTEVAEKIGRAESTTYGYLNEYIQFNNVTDPSPWIDAETAAAISAVVKDVGLGPLKPVYVALNEEVDYSAIRIMMSCIANEG